jgi:hypothetical protein
MAPKCFASLLARNSRSTIEAAERDAVDVAA